MTPEVRYARAGEIFIAYQATGDGPLDVVFLPQLFSNLELMWQRPQIERVFRRIASFARLILFDQRGTGLSDPVAISDLLTLEDRTNDILAVMDAAESAQAVIFGSSLAGPLAAFFAAAHADRTKALVLHNTAAKLGQDDASDVGRDTFDRMSASALESWGTKDFLPTRRASGVEAEWYAYYHRMSMGRAAAAALFRATAALDVRDVLASIHVPTIVLHRSENRTIPVEMGRDLADRIGGAKFVEIAGDNPNWAGPDETPVLDEVQEFLTGVRPVAGTDRVLATVFFSDLVESTAKAAAHGDARWKALLDEHDALVRRQLERFTGRYINTTGDGVVATFDGPARGVRCAQAIIEAVQPLGIEVRAGLHTGEIELRGDDIGGIAVHIAARVMAQAGPGEVVVSSTVKDLVAGSGIVFADRGMHALKGVPDEWRLFAVEA